MLHQIKSRQHDWRLSGQMAHLPLVLGRQTTMKGMILSSQRLDPTIISLMVTKKHGMVSKKRFDFRWSFLPSDVKVPPWCTPRLSLELHYMKLAHEMTHDSWYIMLMRNKNFGAGQTSHGTQPNHQWLIISRSTSSKIQGVHDTIKKEVHDFQLILI